MSRAVPSRRRSTSKCRVGLRRLPVEVVQSKPARRGPCPRLLPFPGSRRTRRLGSRLSRSCLHPWMTCPEHRPGRQMRRRRGTSSIVVIQLLSVSGTRPGRRGKSLLPGPSLRVAGISDDRRDYGSGKQPRARRRRHCASRSYVCCPGRMHLVEKRVREAGQRAVDLGSAIGSAEGRTFPRGPPGRSEIPAGPAPRSLAVDAERVEEGCVVSRRAVTRRTRSQQKSLPLVDLASIHLARFPKHRRIGIPARHRGAAVCAAADTEPEATAAPATARRRSGYCFHPFPPSLQKQPANGSIREPPCGRSCSSGIAATMML